MKFQLQFSHDQSLHCHNTVRYILTLYSLDALIIPLDDSEKHNIHHAVHTSHHHPTHAAAAAGGGILPDGNLHGIHQQQQQHQHYRNGMMNQYHDPARQMTSHGNHMYNTGNGNQNYQHSVSSPNRHEEDLTSDLTVSIHQYRDTDDTNQKNWNRQRFTIVQTSGKLTYYPSKPQTNIHHDNFSSNIQICIQSLYASQQKPSFVSLQLNIDITKSIPNQNIQKPSLPSKQTDERKHHKLYGESTLKYWKENIQNMLYTDMDTIKFASRGIYFQQTKFKQSWKYYHQQYTKYPVFQIFIILLFGYLQVIYFRNYWEKHKSFL